MKKVLHFTIANTGGGITKFVLRLWKYIDRERFHFDFVTMSKQLDFAEELEEEGCKIYYLSTYAEDDIEQFTKEVEEILDNGYDIVHLHTSWWRGFVLEEIAKRKRVKKIIVHCHNTDVHIKENQSREEARQLHLQQRELLTEDMATDFIACSEDAAEWLYADRISKDKIQIIPYAIEVDDYKFNQKTRTRYRKMLNLQAEDYAIGHVGRFAYQKNHDFLIDVFENVCKYNERAKLLLIGVGELEKEIKNKVFLKGLENRVLFLGKRDDVAPFMQAMDIFVFPSKFEGFGIVLIEAQAAGLKCIVSNEVPQIARITDNIDYLSFEMDLWTDRVLEYSRGYARKDMSIILENKGYGMKALTSKFEKIYENLPVNKVNVGGVILQKYNSVMRIGACA